MAFQSFKAGLCRLLSLDGGHRRPCRGLAATAAPGASVAERGDKPRANSATEADGAAGGKGSPSLWGTALMSSVPRHPIPGPCFCPHPLKTLWQGRLQLRAAASATCSCFFSSLGEIVGR